MPRWSKPKGSGETRYTREGKLENPMTFEDFEQGMNHGIFVKPLHRAYCVLLYYTAIRNGEGVKAIKEQFRILPKQRILFDVGERLKHSKKTPVLPIDLKLPYVSELSDAIASTSEGKRVFPFTTRTGYNIVRRAFKYPHYFRLSRITYFFMPHPEVNRPQGFSIAEVHSWTGLSLKALDYYLGLVNIQAMSQSLQPT